MGDFDNYSMKVQAKVVMPTQKEIDAQIRKLEQSISKLKISGKFDDTALKNLTNQLDTLKSTVTTAKFSPDALASLTKQVENALGSVGIGNIKIDNNLKNQAQQTGQQIGNIISDSAEQTINSSSKNLKPFSELKDSIGSIGKKANVIFNEDDTINAENTLKNIKSYFSDFGQVKITNKLFNNGELKSFKVNIEQVNGDLKETRNFMMELSDSGNKFVFPDDIVKGTEKYVQHLNAGKNVVNATGEELNNQKQRLEEQSQYYKEIKKDTEHLYGLKQKLVSSDKLETAELNKQIKSTEQNIANNNQKLNSKNLRDSSLDEEIKSLEAAKQKQLELITVKNQDIKVTKEQTKAQKEQKSLDKQTTNILKKSNENKYSTDYTKEIANVKQWTNENNQAIISTERLTNAFEKLNKATADYGLDSSIENQKKLIQAEKEFASELNTVKNEVSKMNAEYATDKDIEAFQQKVQELYDKNTKAHKKFKDEFDALFNGTKNKAKVTREELGKLNSAYDNLTNSMRQNNKMGDSLWIGAIKQAEKFIKWVGVTTVIMTAFNKVKQMIPQVRELNDAVTEFTMATGMNKKQVDSLVSSYAKLGKELKATVTDVTTSATTWLKQGKTLEEAETLTKDAMILSKVGALDAESATKYLTSAMKGYKVSVEDTLGVVDKLSAVDMASATDVGGLAEGMSEVAAAADLAGVSMDKLLGYLATVGEVTQEEMSSVGTSFNTIFARMGNIKLARLKDYQNSEGVDLKIWGITA